MENSFENRLEQYGAVFVFWAALAFFLTGLNPTFYLDDSPETLTAGVLLGIPHPPGYPLYTLLGRLFTALPLGHLPFRANLLSAVLGSLVCALFYGFLRKAYRISSQLAAPFTLLWAVGATAYPAALSAKGGIYQFTVLFMVGILWTLFENRLELAGFLLGLSMTNHWMTMLTFLPGFGLLLYLRRKEGDIGRKRIYVSLSLFLLGLSTYLFLPIRAAQNPWLNWGNPSTLHNFIFDFLRTQYNTVAGGGFRARLDQGLEFLKAEFLEFAGLFLLALWGFIQAHKRNKTSTLALGLLWLGLSASVVLFLGLPSDQTYLVRNYILPTQVFTLLFGAWGLQNFLEEREAAQRRKAGNILTAALVLLLVVLGAWRANRDRQTDYTYDYDYVLNGLKSLPSNALYICKGDPIVFPLWYFQWVEHQRPDVVEVGLNGLPMEWVRKNLALFHPGLKVPRSTRLLGVESIPALVQWTVKQNPEREVYFSYNDPEDGLLPGLKALPYGLTCKGFLAGQALALDEPRADFIWDHLRFRHLEELGFPKDERTQNLMLGDYGTFRTTLGIYYEDLGDDAKAKIGPHTIASEFQQMNQDYEKCRVQFQWAQQLVPGNAQFNFNLGNAENHLGHSAEAMDFYDRATRINPRYNSAYFNWAVTALQAGKYAKAKELFAKVVELQPGNTQAQQGLNLLNKMNP